MKFMLMISLLICSFCSTFSNPLSHLLSRHYDHAYAQKEAHVRISHALCEEEHAYLNKRFGITKKALESLLKTRLADHEVPRIAFCCSGGGYRSMIATLGLFYAADIPQTKEKIDHTRKGIAAILHDWVHMIAYALHLVPAEDTEDDVATSSLTSEKGLLEIVTYVSCLSGSTWATAGWIDSGLEVGSYLAFLSKSINQHILANPDFTDMATTILQKKYYKQPISLIDYYGALLAQKLLTSKKPSSTTLLSRRAHIKNGSLPFPIYNAIIGDEGEHEYAWIEFTPYEVGSTDLESHIPNWSFGRSFHNSISRDFAAPQTLGYCMGIWGSAMSVTIEELYEQVIVPYLESQNKIIKSIPRDYRVSPARVHNWNFGINGLPLSTQEQLTLIDAGIYCNLPIVPLLRPERSVDIIIIFDASSDSNSDELRKAALVAHSYGYPFPPIDFSHTDDICSVHRHPTDPKAPVIIYMPLIKNPRYLNGWDPATSDFTSTFGFVYTTDQVKKVSGLSSYNLLKSKETILTIIRDWVMQRRDLALG